MREEGGALPATSDDGLALRFSAEHGDTLRYVAMWNKWYRWNGTFWQEDRTVLALSLARDLCRKISRAAGAESKSIASNRTIAAVASLARCDRRHAAVPEQWDRDPWRLNTPGGTVDLRTGDVRSPEANDYITKATATAPAPGPCPLWRAFLNRVLDEDDQLIGFVQRMLGYCLTGSTRDHAMFFLYGLGANGKSVLLDTVTGILGDYHRAAPIEMLIASKHERHPTELAGLVGRRLVTAIETEGGKRWAEAKIKALTGGDRLSARFMCRDFFEFVPEFKLVVAGNHKPSLNTVDEAMRRRFHLVPFTVTIPAAERDTELTNKLKAEWPQILQWAIDGCAEWLEFGLSPCKAVTAATDEYLAAQDTVKNWRAECLIDDPQAETASSVLYASWKLWCEANGEYPGSNKGLSQKLADQGLKSVKVGTTRFRGIRVAG